MRRIEDALAALNDRMRDVVDDEAGDVPGWALITLMTAGAEVRQ